LQRIARVPTTKHAVHLRYSQERTFDPIGLANDERWLVAKRIAAGPHFSKSPLLSRFLLFIVAKALEGRQDEITERQIGVQVFGRPGDYRTVEDNIVRNYARQLRKRLADHGLAEGRDDSIRIFIPLGGYVPQFVPVESKRNSDPQSAVSPTAPVEPVQIHLALDESKKPARRRGRFAVAAWFVLYSILLVALTWFAFSHSHGHGPSLESENPLWSHIFDASRNTYIVPPDAGLNLIEDLSHHPMPLSEYIKNSYREVPLPKMDSHSEGDIRSQQFTGFANLQIAMAIARRPEYRPERVFLRFPRDLRLDDLKSANAILLGSSCSNPWAALAEARSNFQIRCGDDMLHAAILNRKPLDGELASYSSHWNEPVHETYALILFVPNFGGNGNILLLEGLDVAGTQAAAEALLQSAAVARIVARAKPPNGSLAPFEILLRATSIQANAVGIDVIASRID